MDSKEIKPQEFKRRRRRGSVTASILQLDVKEQIRKAAQLQADNDYDRQISVIDDNAVASATSYRPIYQKMKPKDNSPSSGQIRRLSDSLEKDCRLKDSSICQTNDNDEDDAEDPPSATSVMDLRFQQALPKPLSKNDVISPCFTESEKCSKNSSNFQLLANMSAVKKNCQSEINLRYRIVCGDDCQFLPSLLLSTDYQSGSFKRRRSSDASNC